MSMSRQPLRLPLDGPTLEHLRHRERIDWHDHAEQQLVYPSSGLLIVSTAHGSWVVPPQRAVWLPAAVAHAHQAYGATQLRTVAFGVHVNPLGLAQPTVLSVSRLLRELIIAITEGQDRPPGEQDDLRRVALHQLRPAPAVRFHLPQPADERLRDVTAMLAQDPGSGRTLADLGRVVGAGERTLSRLFRAETGMTFPQWRAQLRLHHSLTLLATGRSVTATAVTCGYSTPSAFTAAFRATFGTTPGRYMKEMRSLAADERAERTRRPGEPGRRHRRQQVRDGGLVPAVAGGGAVNQEKEHDGVGGIGQGVHVPGVGLLVVGVVEGLPDPVHAAAHGQHLVPELLETSERVTLVVCVLPRRERDGEEDVAQFVVGHLAARGGGELGEISEDERLRAIEAQEIGGPLARAGLVGHRP
jgi:AraC-like DNA-binding protein